MKLYVWSNIDFRVKLYKSNRWFILIIFDNCINLYLHAIPATPFYNERDSTACVRILTFTKTKFLLFSFKHFIFILYLKYVY